MSVVKSIIAHEGFEPKPYIDVLAKGKIPADEYAVIVKHWDKLVPTFGHGHTSISEADSEQMVRNKVQQIQHSLKTRVAGFLDLPVAVRDVLIEMAYQLGVDGVLKFKKTLLALSSEDFESAADEMLDSLWARQTPKRAQALAEIVRGC